MTPTRQRHDGKQARVETVSQLMALSTTTHFERIAKSSHSCFSSPILLIPAIRAGAMAVALAASTSWAQAAEKIVGVPGWTKGTQTYLRARPGADTPAVAKVPRHTKLYVWGKFNGWYRVETSDNQFGWIYHPYVNAPSVEKVAELSHRKARIASNRTANQEMYGSRETLKNYRETYGYLHQKPATRIASKPKARISNPRLSTRSNTRISTKTRVRVAQRVADQRIASVERERSPLRTISTSSSPVVNRAQTRRAVDTSALREAAANREAAKREFANREATSKREALRTIQAQRNAQNQAKMAQVAAQNAERNRVARLAKAQADETSRANAARYAYKQRVIAEQKRMAQAEINAAARANAEAFARKTRLARLERQREGRAARYQKRLASRNAARQVRQARYRARLAVRQQREKDRQKFMAMQRNQTTSSTRSVTLPAENVSEEVALRPISPQELTQAREQFLNNRSSKNGVSNTSSDAPSPLNKQSENLPEGFTPSSYSEVRQSIVVTPRSAMQKAVVPQNLTLPLGNISTTKTVVTTIASAKKQPVAKTTTKRTTRVATTRVATSLASRSGSPMMRAGMRGGSPRDYARYRAQGSLFGQTMTKQALSYRGRPYIMGAASPNRGFDCSGLIFFLLRQRGYNPPRTAAGLSRFGTSVPRKDLQPGDILLFANTYKRGISHAGIYMGNGKFVHAANRKRGVATDAMSSRYWAGKYWGARRVK